MPELPERGASFRNRLAMSSHVGHIAGLFRKLAPSSGSLGVRIFFKLAHFRDTTLGFCSLFHLVVEISTTCN